MKSLRLFDVKEGARDRWTAAANKLKKHKERRRSMRKFLGRKLPDSFGLLDMALLFKLVDAGRGFGNVNWSAFMDTVQSWI